MLRKSVVALATLLMIAGFALAADKEVKATVVKADPAKMTLTVKTDNGVKEYTISDSTKFVGPKGGVSDAGIKDDRLVKDAEITLIIAANNKTVREVRLPLRR
jgi:hypothetical protein